MEIGRLTLPFEPVTLVAIGDVQLGATGCCADRLKADLDRLGQLDNRVLYIGMGDYVDVASPSNRSRLAAAQLYDSATALIERGIGELEDEFFGLVQATVGKWLGLLEGHHYFEYSPSDTSDTRLANALETRFLGDSCLFRLAFENGRGTIEVPFDIHAWHGDGSGGPSAAMNKLRKKAGHWDADLFLMGHYSQRAVEKFHRVRLRNGVDLVLDSKDITLGLTGGYVKGYVEGNVRGRPQGSYIEQRGYDPVSLGCLAITLTPSVEGVEVLAEL